MENTIVQSVRKIEDIVDKISLISMDPLVSKLCQYIETKYKDNDMINAYCSNNNILRCKNNEGKTITRLEAYFEIWNNTSRKDGGNAMSSIIKYIIKSHEHVTFSLETSVLKKDGSYETMFELTFDTGDKGTDFNETYGNIDFYNFIEKFDTVNHTMRD